ncbi:hypothetical protein [Mycobacterium sp. 155]|uniref:hypothetical protein n=1 Tax=Mycobacterium sp. 155 TaxID=1157943 RepID=UPI0003741501|nr:hypothetical protein [Mycobacterium sp. 155]
MTNPTFDDLAANDCRALAWRRVLAWMDDTNPQEGRPATAEERLAARTTALQTVRYDQLTAGVTGAELDAEELDIYRRHSSTAGHPHMREVGRGYLAGLQSDGAAGGPPPGAEDYQVGTVEDCPDDGLDWPGE